MKRAIAGIAGLAGLFVLVVIVFLVGSVLCYWSDIKGSFWDFSFTDALGIVVTLLVGYFIAVVVNEQLASKAKKRDIVIQLLERLQRAVQTVHTLGDAYMRSPSAEQEPPILTAYTKIYNQLGFLRRLGEKKLHDLSCLQDGTIINLVHKHNTTLTGTGFRSAQRNYDVGAPNRLETAFQALDEGIEECKMKLFE